MEPGMSDSSPSPPPPIRRKPISISQQLARQMPASGEPLRDARVDHDPLLSDGHPDVDASFRTPDDVDRVSQQHPGGSPPSPPRITERMSTEWRGAPQRPGRGFHGGLGAPTSPSPDHIVHSSSSSGNPYDDAHSYHSDLPPPPPPAQPYSYYRPSYGSAAPLVPPVVPPHGTPPVPIFSAARSEPSVSGGSHSSHDRYYDGGQYYSDNPYNRYSTALDPRVVSEVFYPAEIIDDGDDGLEYGPANRNSRSVLSLGRSSTNLGVGAAAAGGVAGAAAGAGTLGKLFKARGSREAVAENQYGPLPQSTEGLVSNAAGPGHIDWSEKQGSKKNKTMGKMVGFGLAVIVVLAIVLGVTLGVLRPWQKDQASAGSNVDNKPPLTQQDPAVQAVLNNKNLHKVFPGMDYTPLNAAQVEFCGNQPPSQNNVTLDVAVLSQLTNRIRLYGTDCNQTELVLEAIKTLKLSSSDMKVWIGVWQDNNSTTNARQLNQMYNILDKYGTDHIAGIIIGNEILFRGDLTVQQLISTITEVRSNLTSKSITLPLAASELGDSWQNNPTLGSAVDVAMANVHPFFGKVVVEKSAQWTYDFWQNSVVAATKTQAKPPQNIIGEVGWPSQGGTNGGSVAGTSELQRFLDDFVCTQMEQGTTFFWFSAFDEPWKIMFDTGDQQWEDHWGLLDVNRKLKSSITIPDCGGKTIS